MNAVILYDEFELVAKANAMLAEAAHRADATVPWSVHPWRLDLLILPQTADTALHDAASAHLIVLAVRSQDELPSWMRNWLETWAERREIQDAALALFDGGNGDSLSAPAAPGLSRFAERHGLSFLFDEVGSEADESTASLDELHEREVAQTPTMKHILEAAPDNYYRGWGLNE